MNRINTPGIPPNRWRLMPFCLVVLAPVLIGDCSASESQVAPLPETAVIEASITPGKPGAPTETVSLTVKQGVGTLSVTRLLSPENRMNESAVLSREETGSVWEIVTKQKLQSFHPVEEKGQVFDFGSQSFTIDLRTEAEVKTDINFTSAQWTAPLTNEKSPKLLFARLGALAAKHCPKLPLAYFPNR